MIEEIIYTSAQKGLKAGSRGFCTVVSTAGMALNTAERLESMSGYRHAFPMQDPRAQHNPVNYSHVTLRIGGKNAHVISRVCDAGQDYSGRTNKLAHHLMLHDVSRLVAGPARLMEDSGVFVTQWDGNVRNVPPRNLPVPILPKSVDLKAWKAATGDSGWAGWVAEQLMKDKAPVSVIFSAGTDTLTLVREALDLLPPTQRWSVTYSTYFTKLLAGTECQLRFVLDDTPEATALRNDARAKVVDLTKGQGAAEGGTLVAQARTGRVQLGNSDMPEPPIQNRSQPQIQAESIRPVVPALGRNVESMSSGSLPEIPTLNPKAPAIPFGSRSGPPELFDEPIRKSKRWTWLLYAAGSLLLMAVASGVTYFVMTEINNAPPGPVETSVVASSETTIAAAAENERPSEPPSTDRQDAKLNRSDVPSDIESKMAAPVANEKDNPNTEGEDSEQMAAAPTGDSVNSNERAVRKASPPDPFALILNDPKFQYPRHDLLLFKLPDYSPENSGKCKLPLVLEKGDQVSLALHAGFANLIEVSSGISFQLTPQGLENQKSEWKAECFHEGTRYDGCGVYQLRHIENSDAQTYKTATHVIEFHAEEFLIDGRDKVNPNLFRLNPLIIEVKSHSGTSVTKVFCQSTRRPLPAETMNGNWKPTIANEAVDLQGLAILNGSDKSMWKMYFEIVTLADDYKRMIHSFQFPERKTNQVTGNLFSNIAADGQKESTFHKEPIKADGECGFIQHDFSWQFEKVNDSNPNVAHRYSVTKDEEAVLLLPAMPDEKSEKQTLPEHSFSKPLSACKTEPFENTACVGSLDLARHPELRLRTYSRSDSKFAENSERLLEKIRPIQSSLKDKETLRKQDLASLEADLKKTTTTADNEEITKIKSQISTVNSHITEIGARLKKLEELSTRFNVTEHAKQFDAFKASQTREKDRVIGYEIAIELKEQKIDNILHPATTIFLVETIFPDEQP